MFHWKMIEIWVLEWCDYYFIRWLSCNFIFISRKLAFFFLAGFFRMYTLNGMEWYIYLWIFLRIILYANQIEIWKFLKLYEIFIREKFHYFSDTVPVLCGLKLSFEIDSTKNVRTLPVLYNFYNRKDSFSKWQFIRSLRLNAKRFDYFFE